MQAPPAVDPRLRQRVVLPPEAYEIAPSHSEDEYAEGTGSGRLRGNRDPPSAATAGQPARRRNRADRRCGRPRGDGNSTDLIDSPELRACRDEALAVIRAPDLAWLFRPAADLRVCVETPVAYLTPEGNTVFGIVDRLSDRLGTLWLVDFKSHRIDDDQALDSLCQHYRSQMTLYPTVSRACGPAERCAASWYSLTRGARLKSRPNDPSHPRST